MPPVLGVFCERGKRTGFCCSAWCGSSVITMFHPSTASLKSDLEWNFTALCAILKCDTPISPSSLGILEGLRSKKNPSVTALFFLEVGAKPPLGVSRNHTPSVVFGRRARLWSSPLTLTALMYRPVRPAPRGLARAQHWKHFLQAVTFRRSKVSFLAELLDVFFFRPC